MYQALHLGTDTHHGKDFVICRSGETGAWIVMCFASDCMVMTKSGLRRAHPEDCFIKSPDFVEHHYTPEDAETGFINDWIHLSGDGLEEELADLCLPVNELFHVQQPLILRTYLSRIMQEKNGLLPFWEQKCSNLVEGMLLRLAKAHYENTKGSTLLYETRFVELRQDLWEHLEETWTVDRMCEQVGLSRSRFSVLYKKRFGRSPNEDLIGMRLEKAKVLLLSTNLGLYDIARNCGFQNEFYFSRIFKEHENLSPGVYREKI